MSDFKGGGINTTDYDSYNTKYMVNYMQNLVVMFSHSVQQV